MLPATVKELKTWSCCPTKTGLELFSKYLQQLVMESLGKERDLDGNVVNQGIACLAIKDLQTNILTFNNLEME